MKSKFFLLYFMIGAIHLSCSDNQNVTVVEKPSQNYTNDFYVSNKLPLSPSPYMKLPIGSIKPEGWLKKQLELQATGFHGHLLEISKFLNKENNAWLDPEGKGINGWEEVPYWLKGYSNCAYVLGNESMINEAMIWLNATISSQQEDGWFGPGEDRIGTATDLIGKTDLWPNMVMLFILQDYHDFSGDERVITLMSNYFKYLQTYPDDKFLAGYWPRMRAGDMLYSVYWLYNRTGESWLLDFAEKIHRNTADWDEGIVSWHNVNIAQAFGQPSIFWMQSKKTGDMQAAERNWQKIRDNFGQVPGGMFGSDEVCRLGYDGPRQGIETCAIVEEMLSEEILTRITGDLIWADRCENVAFNTLPAAFTPDMKALRYLTAPNMPQSDKGSKSPGVFNAGPMLEMNPHIHRCCQHNSGHGWPYYAQNLWYATPDNGLAAILLSASKVTATVGKGTLVTVTEKTHYPFDESIEFTINTSHEVQFPLYLRIPGWCNHPELNINQKRVKLNANPGHLIKIDRLFRDGDIISLRLPMELELKEWKKNKNSISVNYGPLTFSLKIDEKYVQSGGTEKWPAWEIYPVSPWNYGLELDAADPIVSFEVIKKEWPETDMPFTPGTTPVEIRAKARKIPQWTMNQQGLVNEIQQSPVRTTEPLETVTLIPMGAARLRISAFPVVSTADDARDWDVKEQVVDQIFLIPLM